jgi:hypothetical protein
VTDHWTIYAIIGVLVLLILWRVFRQWQSKGEDSPLIFYVPVRRRRGRRRVQAERFTLASDHRQPSNVRLWHKADMLVALGDVRFWR